MKEWGYSLAADSVVAIHFTWILFLIGGALIGRRVRWVKWLHLSALTYSLLLQIFSWICPLTTLEVWMRSRGLSGESYSGSFIAVYLEKAIYIQIPQAWLLFLTVLVVGGSAVIYYRAPGTRTNKIHDDS